MNGLFFALLFRKKLPILNWYNQFKPRPYFINRTNFNINKANFNSVTPDGIFGNISYYFRCLFWPRHPYYTIGFYLIF